MLRLKGCPRCRGDVVIEQDDNGWYEECIQCGYQRDLKRIAEAHRKVKREKVARV